MSRDKRKNDRYFEDYIIFQNKRIAKFKSMAETQPDTEQDKRKKILRIVGNFQKDLFTAKYSIGASKQELKKIFDDYIEILQIIKTNEYGEYVDVMAIGVLFDMNLKDLQTIAGNDGLHDGIVNVLVNYPDISNKPLCYPQYYQAFYDYITGKTDIEEFSKYLSVTWYDSSKEFSWYDSHKSKENVYVGYWCWLAAACIILRKEKSIYNIPYIPYDLL